MELAIFLLLCLGLRRGELIGLKWVDVNWEKSQITICRSLVLKDGELTEKPPKTESSNRTIDVPTELMQILKNVHTEYIKEKLRLGAALMIMVLLSAMKNVRRISRIPFHRNSKPFFVGMD